MDLKASQPENLDLNETGERLFSASAAFQQEEPFIYGKKTRNSYLYVWHHINYGDR